MYDVQAVLDEIQRTVLVAAKRHKALRLETEVKRVARLHPTALFPLNELRALIARTASERQVSIELA